MTITIDTEGLHPSSALCLEMLSWLHERHDLAKALEIGCGNGILSVVTASIWGAEVVAGDISPKAIEDTKNSIILHKLNDFITPLRSDGLQHAEIKARAPYDLVICNLLAELLVQFSLDIKNVIIPNGYIIMGGVMQWKAAETEATYSRLGFEIQHKISNSPWNCYLWQYKTVNN